MKTHSTLKLHVRQVGPWPMNAYAVVNETSRECFLVDPGADPGELLSLAAGMRVVGILLTHGHADHTGALAEVRQKTGAPVYAHPADVQICNLQPDLLLGDQMTLDLGGRVLQAIHAPGHTPGSTCFDLGDGRILVGDVVFVGGPGRTQTPEDFALTVETMRRVVFTWPAETRFYPGHGPSGLIGQERRAFEAFLRRGWPPDLHGDVTWEA